MAYLQKNKSDLALNVNTSSHNIPSCLLVDKIFSEYSRLPLNPYLSVDGPSYGLWGFTGYERALLVQNENLVLQKSMGYIMRG